MLLIIVLAFLVVVLLVAVVVLAMAMQRNIRIQAKVTADLLMELEATHKAAVKRMQLKLYAAWKTIDEKELLIDDLEKSAELLNSEINRLEEINMLEHNIRE